MMRLFIEKRLKLNFAFDRKMLGGLSRAWQFAREYNVHLTKSLGQFLRWAGIRKQGRCIVIFEIAEKLLP
ncbi:MAG: hypothetical protein C3F11_04675 [Methylocystaceae bacterium]|nr:MAG: hypothetical protein C3F11_04675 [Methylocystaceae bacterium]